VRANDFRLAGLKLIFLIVARAVSLLGLSQREAWWKDTPLSLRWSQPPGAVPGAAMGGMAGNASGAP
jgi:hypothetical protein